MLGRKKGEGPITTKLRILIYETSRAGPPMSSRDNKAKNK